MLTIARDQARKRFVTIPVELQDAFFSDRNGEILSSVADDNHFDDQKTNRLSEIVGWVLLGFIHPGDLAGVLRDELSVPLQVGEAVSNSLATKIFNSLAEDLEKAYAPAPLEATSTLAVGPKILEEIRPGVPVPARPPMAPVLNMPKVPTPPMDSAGWSKPQPAPPVGGTTPVSRPAPSYQPPTVNLQKTEMGKISVPMPMPPQPGNLPSPFPLAADRSSLSASSGPAPVMMGGEVTARPIPKMPDFKTVLDDKIAAVSKFPQPPGMGVKPAVLEFSGMKSPSPKPPSAPHTVNYADAPREQGRQVTEMTGGTPAPKPPVPMPPQPMAPPIPMPPPGGR